MAKENSLERLLALHVPRNCPWIKWADGTSHWLTHSQQKLTASRLPKGHPIGIYPHQDRRAVPKCLQERELHGTSLTLSMLGFRNTSGESEAEGWAAQHIHQVERTLVKGSAPGVRPHCHDRSGRHRRNQSPPLDLIRLVSVDEVAIDSKEERRTLAEWVLQLEPPEELPLLELLEATNSGSIAAAQAERESLQHTPTALPLLPGPNRHRDRTRGLIGWTHHHTEANQGTPGAHFAHDPAPPPPKPPRPLVTRISRSTLKPYPHSAPRQTMRQWGYVEPSCSNPPAPATFAAAFTRFFGVTPMRGSTGISLYIRRELELVEDALAKAAVSAAEEESATRAGGQQ